jgi:hypothetical protein
MGAHQPLLVGKVGQRDALHFGQRMPYGQHEGSDRSGE